MGYRGDVTNINAVTNGSNTAAHSLRVWAGTVQSNSSGSWTVDLRNAKFQNVYSVTATAQYDATNVANVPIAGIRTYNTTQATGWVVQSNNFTIVLGGGGAGLKFCTTPVTIHIQVVGD